MEKYDVQFKKKYGQNFLKNHNVVHKIVDVADIKDSSLVIEVGPGGGIMTEELAKRASFVLAYEIDCDLEEEQNKRLSSYSNVEIRYCDFLKQDLFADIQNFSYEHCYFISNIPYNITSPIVLKLLFSNVKFDRIVLMVQKEVGDRFSATPGSKLYGSITVLLQYFYDVKKNFIVSKNEFVPSPKVDSVVVSFIPRENRSVSVHHFSSFEKLVRDSFQFKRKTIKNNLKKYDLSIVSDVLAQYSYDLSVRAENLSVDIFVALANTLFP